MIEDGTRNFYDLLSNWHWGEVGDLVINDPATPLTLSDLHQKFCIEGANLALQEVLGEFQDGCSLGLDADNGNLVISVSLFDDFEFTKTLDEPFKDIALNDPETARNMAKTFRKLAKQLDQAAKAAHLLDQ